MSILPFLLNELQRLSVDQSARAPRRCYDHNHDVDDLLGNVLLAQEVARPSSLLQLLDSPAFVNYPALVLGHRSSPRQQLRRAQTVRQRGQDQSLAAVDQQNNALLINLDVQQFRPEELSVQVLKDEGFVVIEGKHEERQDEHGFVQRQFTRRYKLPPNVDPDTVTSRLSSDGVLQISAPRKEIEPPKELNVKHIPITHTNEPAVAAVEEDTNARQEEKAQEGEGDK